MSVLNLDPNHIPSLCCVGAMYKARGMLQASNASNACRPLSRLKQGWLNMTACCLSWLQEAMSAYAKAHELCPENTEIKVALAAILTDLGTRAKTTGQSVLPCNTGAEQSWLQHLTSTGFAHHDSHDSKLVDTDGQCPACPDRASCSWCAGVGSSTPTD
jgi:hypothetical protein